MQVTISAEVHRSEESSDEDGDEQVVTVASQPTEMDQQHQPSDIGKGALATFIWSENELI